MESTFCFNRLEKSKMVEERLNFFTWDIHYECNYNCTYCFLHFEPEKANIKAVYLESEKWIEIWQNIYKMYGPCHILVTGGEPFIYPSFIDFISELSKIHTFEFSTNLSWDIDYFIKKANSQKIKIEASFHPEFIKPDEFLKRALKLKEKEYLISTTFVAYPPLINKIGEYKKLFEANGIEFKIYPYRGPYLNKKYPEEYTDREREILEKEGYSIGPRVSKDLLKAYDTNLKKEEFPVEKRRCYMGQRYAKIIPNGDAYRCCAAVGKDWGDLGNIINNTFKFLSELQDCPSYEHCRCYKAMIVGEESKWGKYWQPVLSLKKKIIIEKKLNIAKSLRDEGKLSEAINKICEILTDDLGNTKALTLLGEIYLRQKNFLGAEVILHNALRNNSDADNDSWIYRTLGRLYCDLGLSLDNKPDEKMTKFTQAIDLLLKAIISAKESNNIVDKAWASYDIAFVYYNQGDYQLAQEYIRIALEYEPQNEYFKKLSDLINTRPD